MNMTDTEIPLPRPRKGGGGMKGVLGRIISWRPFVAKSIYNDGFEYRFICPRCKGHNAVKAPHSSGHHFLEGHYQCTDCGLTEYEQKVIGGRIELSPITYYSDCFERVKEQPSLFEL